MKKSKLAKTLKALMDKKGVTQAEVVKATGIPAATFSSLTSGGQSQKPEHLLALSQYFGTSIEFLLFGEDNRVPTLDEVLTEGVFSGWLKVTIEKAIPSVSATSHPHLNTDYSVSRSASFSKSSMVSAFGS